jgi:hypothetical protein
LSSLGILGVSPTVSRAQVIAFIEQARDRVIAAAE